MELTEEDEAKSLKNTAGAEDQAILYDINTFTHPNWISEINLNKVTSEIHFRGRIYIKISFIKELNAYAKYQKSRVNPYRIFLLELELK